jgi:hypothetical protein
MRRASLLVAACVLSATSGCSSSYVTSDGGVVAPDASGGDDATAAGDDAAPDASAEVSCAAVPVQPVPSHGGPACPSDASACFPGDVTAFTPRWVEPFSGAPHANACTTQQIAAALADCFGSSTSACGAWRSAAAANETCYGCLLTDVSAPRYGALIGSGAYSQINFATCIALAEPCNQPCAAAILAYIECDLDACDPLHGACAVTDQASLTRYDGCISAANTTCGCAGFSAATECFTALQQDPKPHPAVALCDVGGSDFGTAFTRVATFLCGP